MKKLLLITGLLTNLVFTANAIHITGGEMYYIVTGQANGEIQYQFTLKLYMRCNSGRTLPNPAIISIFDKGTSARVSDLNVPMSNTETISYNNTNPCISDPPDICFVIGYYSFNVSLPPSSAGYVLASTANFRINSISNLVPGNSRIGALYSAEIPGNASLAGAAVNNSAEFIGSDLVLICANNPFSYSFAATDADGDQLRYSFCDAYQSNTDGSNAVPPNPPFSPVPYYYPYYGGGNPLGPGISIDQNTGLITGVAPDEGVYIVTVCVDEIRNGVVIATQRKDVQINSAP
ncbi:MAG: hypothetical protein JSU05_09180, partial [Bacteroidetes bacterium]|nr:hypothetical protein [Bacteroidota bacterium]